MSALPNEATKDGPCGIPLRLALAAALGCEFEGQHQYSPAVERLLVVLGLHGVIDHHQVKNESPPQIRWSDEPNNRGLCHAEFEWQCGAKWACWRHPGHVFSEDTEGEYWLTNFHNYGLREDRHERL